MNVSPQDSVRTDTTFDDQKRPSYRQHHVNGLLPQSLIISLGVQKRAEDFNFCLSGALFWSLFGHRYPHHPGVDPRAGDGRAVSALSRSDRVRATNLSLH